MSRVINMVGGGGGSADSFMELIGATEVVEMTYTPTYDATNFYLPNTSGRRYKGIIIDSEQHSTESGYKKYVDYLIAPLDDTKDYTNSVPTGRYTWLNQYNLFAYGDVTYVYLTNVLNNGIFVYEDERLYFKSGKTYNIKLFY